MDETFGIRIFTVFWTFLNFGYFKGLWESMCCFFVMSHLFCEVALNIEQAW